MKSLFLSILNTIQKYRIWLFGLFCIDLFFSLLLWLSDTEKFLSLIGVIFLGSLLFFSLVLYYTNRKENHFRQLFLHFLQDPNKQKEEELLPFVCTNDFQLIQKIGCLLRKNLEQQAALHTQINDYEEYVEAWAHEIKTPLSLLTFLLDNHREELEPSICYKLDYIQNQIQESISQMLYYARLKGTKKDYLFEPLSLSICCEEAVENYRPLLNEKNFQITQKNLSATVLSDKRGLEFILNQIISNSIKYCTQDQTPQISFFTRQTKSHIFLSVQDNGIGVYPCDLPFLFEKGFTGSTSHIQKKATGMGLYLAKAVADDLTIQLAIQSERGKGVEVTLIFPNLSL